MKYQGCLLAVKDIAVAKDFYENVLHQKVQMDAGTHVMFDGISLQEGYAELKQHSDIVWVHEIIEYPWGQRDMRLYDPDKHIIEIAEEMGTVIKRFMSQGMTIEQVSERTMFPIESIKYYLS